MLYAPLALTGVVLFSLSLLLHIFAFEILTPFVAAQALFSFKSALLSFLCSSISISESLEALLFFLAEEK